MIVKDEIAAHIESYHGRPYSVLGYRTPTDVRGT